MDQPFSVAHLSTQTTGGAGVAAMRLHQSLSTQNIHSQYYFSQGDRRDNTSHRLTFSHSFTGRVQQKIQEKFLQTLSRSKFFFTSPTGNTKTKVDALPERPDIVNLHFTARWLDLPSFVRSIPEEMPIVWSLHDMNAFTGGCHLSYDCTQYQAQCHRCPAVKAEQLSMLATRYQRIKEKTYRHRNLHVVANSEWMLNAAKSASAFKHVRSFNLIHLGIDVESFSPRDQKQARALFGIPQDKFVICFGSADLNDENKGIRELMDALVTAKLTSKVVLLLFGGGWPERDLSDVEVRSVGYVSEPSLLSLVYSAADMLAFPSKFETFGLTALEAMACSIPVVASDVGGVPDIVVNGETGFLIPPDDVGKLADSISTLCNDRALCQTMGKNARKRAAKNFSHIQTTENYVDLYRQILDQQKMNASGE